MPCYKKQTLAKYLDELAARKPIPGGGSAAALAGALGAGLLSMVAQYSLKRGKPKGVEKKLRDSLAGSERIRKRLLVLVDLDAKAYLNFVRSRPAGAKAQKAASKKAKAISYEICRLCYEATQLSAYLVQQGSPYLISDIRAAVEMLLAGFTASLEMIEANA